MAVHFPEMEQPDFLHGTIAFDTQQPSPPPSTKSKQTKVILLLSIAQFNRKSFPYLFVYKLTSKMSRDEMSCFEISKKGKMGCVFQRSHRM